MGLKRMACVDDALSGEAIPGASIQVASSAKMDKDVVVVDALVDEVQARTIMEFEKRAK